MALFSLKNDKRDLITSEGFLPLADAVEAASKEPIIDDREQLSQQKLLVREVYTRRPVFDIKGNQLSMIAVVDFGTKEYGLFVVDGQLGGKLHESVREKLKSWGGVMRVERRADVAFIATLNNAISSSGKDANASDSSLLIKELYESAFDVNGSDVHLECRKDTDGNGFAVLKYRIHSQMVTRRQYSVPQADAMVAYMFTHMSDRTSLSDPTFRPDAKSQSCMVPMKGKDNREYKLRLKYITLADGWDLIARVLPAQAEEARSFEQLGYEKSQIDLMRNAVCKSIGLTVICGPTGSGKTTTLKTMMEFDPARGRRKRYSVEDPVEFKIFGVSQISIRRNDHDDDGSSAQFLGVLRDVLRGDPDDVMVGEVRDSETAKLVSEFVLTGHKIYTSIHSSGAIQTYLRLNCLGVHQTIMTARDYASIFMFQRLLPTLCPKCKIKLVDFLGENPKSELQKTAKEIEYYFKLNLDDIYVANHSGCDQPGCFHGVSGTTVVAEVFMPDPQIRQMISESKYDAAEVYWRKTRKTAYDDPDMTGKTAFEHALYKMSKGLIDPRSIEAEFEKISTYERIDLISEE